MVNDEMRQSFMQSFAMLSEIAEEVKITMQSNIPEKLKAIRLESLASDFISISSLFTAISKNNAEEELSAYNAFELAPQRYIHNLSMPIVKTLMEIDKNITMACKDLMESMPKEVFDNVSIEEAISQESDRVISAITSAIFARGIHEIIKDEMQSESNILDKLAEISARVQDRVKKKAQMTK